MRPNKALQLTPHRSLQSVRGTVWRRAPAPPWYRSARCGAAERPSVGQRQEAGPSCHADARLGSTTRGRRLRRVTARSTAAPRWSQLCAARPSSATAPVVFGALIFGSCTMAGPSRAPASFSPAVSARVSALAAVATLDATSVIRASFPVVPRSRRCVRLCRIASGATRSARAVLGFAGHDVASRPQGWKAGSCPRGRVPTFRIA